MIAPPRMVFFALVLLLTVGVVSAARLRRDTSRHLYAQAGTVSISDGPQIGSPAPDFTLPDTNGHMVSLSSFRGHTTVLGFFCGCGRCRESARQIAALQRQGKIKHFVAIVGLIPGAAAKFQKETGFRGAVLSDQSDQVQEMYQSSFCPRLWVLSSSGQLQYKSTLALEGLPLRSTLQTL